jgi:hypothetical protein
VRRASGPVLMFCTSRLVFDDTEGVGSRFDVLRPRTRFWLYLGHRVQFSYFTLLNSFSEVSSASGPVFMFCAPIFIFGGSEGVGSRFLILRPFTRFRQNRGRRVTISYFALPNSFTTVSRASGPVFLFSSLEIAFGGTEGVWSCFHILRAQTRFRRYRWRRVPFSSFAIPFGGAEGVGSRFNVLHFRTHFRRFRGRQVPFSCFALSNSFSTVPRVSGPVFIFCAPELVFGGTDSLGSHFHVLRSRNRFQRYRRSWVPFSCFALPDSFSAILWASSPFFLFCTPKLVFDSTDSLGSHFHVFAPEHIFGGTDSVGSRFHVPRPRTHFRQNLERRVTFSCFALPN